MKEMGNSYLDSFMKGYSGAVELYKRANDNGYFIESVCLGASVIDGALRMGLNLKHQIETKSSEIIIPFLMQKEDDKIIPERQIYKFALKNEIITSELHEKLGALYNDRNRVIHRYIISEITTGQVLDIAIKYEQAIHEVNKAIYKLEREQIEIGVGMTTEFDGDVEKWMSEMSEEKHGGSELTKRLRAN